MNVKAYIVATAASEKEEDEDEKKSILQVFPFISRIHHIMVIANTQHWGIYM